MYSVRPVRARQVGGVWEVSTLTLAKPVSKFYTCQTYLILFCRQQFLTRGFYSCWQNPANESQINLIANMVTEKRCWAELLSRYLCTTMFGEIYVQQYIAPPVIPDYDGLINVFFCWAEGQYLGTLPKQMIRTLDKIFTFLKCWFHKQYL